MTTELLAIAIGIYALAAAAGMWRDPAKVEALLKDFQSSPGLSYVTGAFVFFLGAFLLIVHHRWDGVLESVVTLIALAAAIEGLAFLIGPGAFIALARRWWQPGSARLWAGFAAAFGLLLVIGGLLGG